MFMSSEEKRLIKENREKKEKEEAISEFSEQLVDALSAAQRITIEEPSPSRWQYPYMPVFMPLSYHPKRDRSKELKEVLREIIREEIKAAIKQ